jgi:hypothetical protein
MFNRRTLAAFAAIAALAGGASGAVTSTVTTPEGASAAEPPHININPGTPPDDRLGSTPVRRSIPDSVKIQAIWQGVAKLNQAQVRMDARLNTLDARSTALTDRMAETKETIESLAGMTGRGANGRSLINLVEDTLHKTRLICGETVPVEVLGISGHDSRCD